MFNVYSMSRLKREKLLEIINRNFSFLGPFFYVFNLKERNRTVSSNKIKSILVYKRSFYLKGGVFSFVMKMMVKPFCKLLIIVSFFKDERDCFFNTVINSLYSFFNTVRNSLYNFLNTVIYCFKN